MNEGSTQILPQGRVQCRRVGEQLVLFLPRKPRRAAKSTVGAVLCLTVFLVIGCLLMGELPPLPAIFALSAPVVFLVPLLLYIFIRDYFSKTFVLITPKSLILETEVFGRVKLREYPLNVNSQASQVCSFRWEPEPDAIAIQTDSGEVRFGEGLSKGELDWSQWRINRHLGKLEEVATPSIAAKPGAVAPIEGMPDVPAARPQGTKLRITDDFFETRISLPNSFAMKNFRGIGRVALGASWATVGLFLVAEVFGQRHIEHASALVVGLFTFFGVVVFLSGMTRLFGNTRLTISPERITYRVSLLGIGYRLTLRTAEVISAGMLQTRRRPKDPIPPGRYCVIRTADRELEFGKQLSRPEREWLAGEIGKRINAVRTAGIGGHLQE